ncbi:uncharacterized protein LOC128207524 [Mya arenaria]|uniref:uncharacterized protein LOC128207524 n=1 Tax=Mya arenaria TaxID=6604 RepID=UPI0022E1C1DD|nr:uncharacterized protein LOC128207524 [Mya arenaria]XP_052766438.1 uncharacterized protein LOC128207524 [Mya arenaria]XP_052766439.1 uncharacterized protein LOC128207524 [Mya arenaria]
MAELDLERPPAVSHSELTAGRDVTHLLSHINQNFRQSKADQILRLLRDQDKLQDKLQDVRDVDDDQLIKEYELIREERVVNDSDTLTDSSSISEIECTDIKEDTNEDNNIDTQTMNGNTGNAERARDIRGYKASRSRTSMGFYNDGQPQQVNEHAFTTQMDTRDLSVRPKSSYVRRNQFRKHFEADVDGGEDEGGEAPPPPVRASKSARPKSRLGRASVQRSERKIAMVEAEIVTATTPVEPQTAGRDDQTRGANIASTSNMYDRFASVRQAKRESKRGTKAFCDSSVVPQREHTVENMSVDSSGGHSGDARMDEVTEIQSMVQPLVSVTNNTASVTSTLVREPSIHKVSSFNTSTVPRGSPVQVTRTSPVQQPPSHPQKRPHVASRPEHQLPNRHPPQNVDPNFVRSETMVHTPGVRPERQERYERHERTQVPLRHSNSNLGYHGRPKNPEPITSRPIERTDMRPSTRTRRLQRRYMQQSQGHGTNVRPTSESVILARQKTEKNLLKQKSENRPHSEKIVNSNKMLSVSENPTQGPQTYVTSKSGVTQASHVQTGGFRGYDPSRNLKNSVQSRDLPSDLTLPRQRPNMVMGSGKAPLTLMKLPPLEASLAAKKKERGLTLAQRETCV